MSNQQNNNNNSNNNNNNNNNGFFDKNPIIVFVLFSIVTIMAFKSFFPSDAMNVNGGSVPYGKTTNKSIAYSDLKELINNGQIKYVGIGQNSIKAISNSTPAGQTIYTTRRVSPDNTLIPMLEEKKINYGGINEENILSDILFGWLVNFLKPSLNIVACA